MTEKDEKNLNNQTSHNHVHSWRVVLYNDERSNMTDVAYHLQNAVATSSSHAMQLAMIAHQQGEVTMFNGSFFECQEIADVLREFGLTVEILG